MAKLEMADLLDLVLEEGASDLHLPCYSPPVIRIHGEMTPLDVPPMQPEDTEYLMKSITSEANQQKLQQDTRSSRSAISSFAMGCRRPPRTCCSAPAAWCW